MVAGQLTLEKKEHNFGTLLRSSQNWVDFPLTNNTNKPAYIFRVELEKGFEAKFSAKKILPGKTEYIRISFTPRSEGEFKFELPIYTSAWSQPQNITVKGQSTYAESGIIPCPAFGESRPLAMVNFGIELIDPDGSPIENAEVTIKPSSGEKMIMKTDEFGRVKQGLTYGPYSILIEKETVRFDTVFQINAVNDFLSLSLEYSPDEAISEQITVSDVGSDKEPSDTISLSVDLAKEPDTPAESDSNEAYPNFSLDEYKPNNLVFLVDVSTSMKQDGKLDLLKATMIELLELLRPVDRFALISYSSDTKVLVETASNLNKEDCIASIRSLEAGGNTAGARALKKAREVSLDQFIEAGNNEVFLATDGAFNEGVEKALKEARRMKRKNVKLSVLGIKCGSFTTKQMQELVSEGKGDFVNVVSKNEAGSQLINQVKKNSEYSK